MIQTDDLLRMRWSLGGRGPDVIDCFGVCLVLLARMGKPIEDAWQRLKHRWRAGEDPAELLELPPGPDWSLIAPTRPPRNGDLWILGPDPLGAGVVLDGRLWTATRESGVVALQIGGRTPMGVWRA